MDKRTPDMEPHSEADDALSLRIFRDEPPPQTEAEEDNPQLLQAEVRALRRQNQALRKNQHLFEGLRQRFEALYDSADSGFLTIAADDCIAEANLRVAQWLGMEREHLIGQHVGNFIVDDDHATFIRHLKTLREQGGHDGRTERCVLHLRDRKQKPMLVRLESVFSHHDPLSPLTQIYTTLYRLQEPREDEESDLPEDNAHQKEIEALQIQLQEAIRERERAEEKALQRQQRLAHLSRLNTVGEMASGLAHEINQPLAAIATYSQSCLHLLRNHKDPQKVIDILEQIVIQSQRAANIVQHLRNFVTKGESHRELTELAKVLRNAISMARNEIIKNNIELDVIPHDNLPPIQADPVQIEQVILNLLRNAIEAMLAVPPDSRRLRIAVTQADDQHLRVSISDTGPGISDANTSQISAPFFSTKEDGMGLGLAISRTIIEDHGGTLSCEPASNGGATFHFTLALNGQAK
jgi:PAS domain S-box-containing protein